MIKMCRTILAILLIACWCYPAYADDVLEAIEEGIAAYKEKSYADAVESLEYAKQLIRQMQSENIIQFLPKALPGWEADSAQTQNMGMLGGMSTVEKIYRRSDKGESEIKITIIGQSPMMQGMMAMFNPMIAGSDGGKLQRIQRNKAIVKYDPDEREGEINVQVENNYIINIEGSNVEEEDLLKYAEAVDYKGLKSF